MRLPRVRLTVRRMMAAIAVVAILIAVPIGTLKVLRRARLYRMQAQFHARSEKVFRDLADQHHKTVEMLTREWERLEDLQDARERDPPGDRAETGVICEGLPAGTR